MYLRRIQLCSAVSCFQLAETNCWVNKKPGNFFRNIQNQLRHPAAQFPRIDLYKRFLPRPKTTAA